MQRIDGSWIFAASDINDYLACRHLAELEILVATGKRRRPDQDDEQTGLMREKGDAHERAHLERLRHTHRDGVVELERPRATIEAYRAAQERTLDAMRAGVPVIYQATFFDETFLGRADFLRRVERPSTLGAWSYEAVDTKLALSTKPYFVVQLCNYSEHLARLQGTMPARASIVFGNDRTLTFELNAYLVYYRHVKSRFLAFTAAAQRLEVPASYPLPCEHCSFCPWDDACRARRIDDDHLSLVARMRQDQLVKLEAAGIDTLAKLAATETRAAPPTLAPESFATLHAQARLQLESRERGEPLVELLAHDPRTGFGLLPEPAPGDVYFDMEGDPLYEPRGGLEYLFGCWLPDDLPHFRSFWGRDRCEERRAFEAFIDFIVERRRRFPSLHVYHYAQYEKTALCRLSQQHSTRGRELDDLLRGEVFVDLFAVVRQAIRIGEDSYSIKRLERFYGLERSTAVKKGDQSIVMFERWRITGDHSILDDIEAYNRDDCESTALLHRWLLAQRERAIATLGIPFAFRRPPQREEPCHTPAFDGCATCQKREKERREDERRSAAERALLERVVPPDDDDAYAAMDEEERTRYLLAHLLSYYRRESYPTWWELFRRCEEIDTLQDRDSSAIGGLELDESIAPYRQARSMVYSYRFPEQRHKLERGTVWDPGARARAGELIDIDDDERILRLKRTSDSLEEARAIKALIPPGPIPTQAQIAAIAAIADAHERGTLDQQYPATVDLLRRRPPRTNALRHPGMQPPAIDAESVSAVVSALDESYAFIQGPPGSGKSTIGSQVIADLLQAGKRVAVMSNGHKPIQNLLHKVEAVLHERGAHVRGLYKHGSDNSRYESRLATPYITSVNANAPFDADDYQLAGGTAWLFSREELRGRFDYLVIDEAGQVSLADALAASLCARNIVLLGDPSQLAQVTTGTHALHADDSVLEHLLGAHETVPPERGIFLDRSYRMHPDICAFISETMYEGRLAAAPQTALHRVDSPSLRGAGLRFVSIPHDHNSAASPQEADRIVSEIAALRTGTVTDDDGIARPLLDRDIIVVTPYNAQRRLIARKLRAAGHDIAVGTVDKFQGQEAAVVFYSLATSSAADVPRDVGFLFESNRINVAISRARALSVLVCSPRLLDVPCRTAEEMALVNLLCAYVERASP